MFEVIYSKNSNLIGIRMNNCCIDVVSGNLLRFIVRNKL